MEYPVNYDSPAELKSFLESAGLSMKKRFGQNFLVNKGAREKIVSVLPVKSGDNVWEIGPGLGAMTWHLIEKKANVTVYEIDHGFIGCLKKFYGACENFSLIEGDFLKTFKGLKKDKAEVPDYIMGNLPYVTGSVMIAEIVKSEINPTRMVFTLQKEVGRRMAAAPGSKDYSSFSLVCQSKYDIVLKGDLNPGSFYPKPAVKSIVVEMTAHNRFNPGSSENSPELYYQLIDDLFRARRKKILNNLSAGQAAAQFGKEQVMQGLKASGLDPDCRAENLSVADIERLSRNLLK